MIYDINRDLEEFTVLCYGNQTSRGEGVIDGHVSNRQFTPTTQTTSLHVWYVIDFLIPKEHTLNRSDIYK